MKYGIIVLIMEVIFKLVPIKGILGVPSSFEKVEATCGVYSQSKKSNVGYNYMMSIISQVKGSIFLSLFLNRGKQTSRDCFSVTPPVSLLLSLLINDTKLIVEGTKMLYYKDHKKEKAWEQISIDGSQCFFVFFSIFPLQRPICPNSAEIVSSFTPEK